MGKRIKVALSLFLVLSGFIVSFKDVQAFDINCGNRFVTLVNPVRSRNLWGFKTLKPIQDQYSLISKNRLPATWLLQYDVLEDKNLSDYIRNFNDGQETGLLLEISPQLASTAEVIYPQSTPWANPKALFLSGYNRHQRVKLIDSAFRKFKDVFGIYPKSVGAWWIDSYSLERMVKKYKIKAVMIVADQRTTDKYGVWGQWWGVPYYPSRSNLLVPADNSKNKLGIVAIQWAQRDLTKAYGEGPDYSNFSLQANDYKERGLNTAYFSDLVDRYLDCTNKIGQVTVGLETGIESIAHNEEYEKQIDSLLDKTNLQFETMSGFADKFSQVLPENSEIKLTDNQSVWVLDTQKRKNDFLNDNINYDTRVSFPDYFIADKSDSLVRWLPLSNKFKPSLKLLEFSGFTVIFLFFLKFIGLREAMVAVLFATASYGLIFRSDFQNGWSVFYSSPFDNLILIQITLFILGFIIVYLFGKFAKTKNGVFLLSMVYGVDVILRAFRLSKISGKYLMGFAKSETGFFGISFGENSLNFVNKIFDSSVAASLLRINFDKLFLQPLFSLFFYPILHIIAAYLLLLLIRKVSLKYKIVIIILLFILFSVNFFVTFASDPLAVRPLL